MGDGTQVMLVSVVATLGLLFLGPRLLRALTFSRRGADQRDRGNATSGSTDRALGAYRTLDQPTRDAEASDPGEVLLPFKGRACCFCNHDSFTDSNPVVMNGVCRPSARMEKCPVPGTHTHRNCLVCKAAWLSQMPDEEKK